MWNTIIAYTSSTTLKKDKVKCTNTKGVEWEQGALLQKKNPDKWQIH